MEKENLKKTVTPGKKALSEKELDYVVGGSWASFWNWIVENIFASHGFGNGKKSIR